jgi:hypothetical protein
MLTQPDSRSNDWFGFAVAVSGTSIAVAAPKWDGSNSDFGAVYVYVKTSGSWTLQQTIADCNALNCKLGYRCI